MLSGNALLPHHTRRQVVAHSTFPGRGPRRNAASFQQGVRLAQSRRSGVRAPPLATLRRRRRERLPRRRGASRPSPAPRNEAARAAAGAGGQVRRGGPLR